MDSNEVQYEHGYKLGFVKDGKVRNYEKLVTVRLIILSSTVDLIRDWIFSDMTYY